jgi:hypothetical protein
MLADEPLALPVQHAFDHLNVCIIGWASPVLLFLLFLEYLILIVDALFAFPPFVSKLLAPHAALMDVNASALEANAHGLISNVSPTCLAL